MVENEADLIQTRAALASTHFVLLDASRLMPGRPDLLPDPALPALAKARASRALLAPLGPGEAVRAGNPAPAARP